jgi:hypothetical protein
LTTANDRGDWATFRPERGELILTLDPSRALLARCKAYFEDVKTKAVQPKQAFAGKDRPQKSVHEAGTFVDCLFWHQHYLG